MHTIKILFNLQRYKSMDLINHMFYPQGIQRLSITIGYLDISTMEAKIYSLI